jgi:hypothetical protein
MNDERILELARGRTRYLDHPDLQDGPGAAAICQTWLPLAHVDGVGEDVRALAWEAARVIEELPGVVDPDRAEQCIVAAAWGLAGPEPEPTAITLACDPAPTKRRRGLRAQAPGTRPSPADSQRSARAGCRWPATRVRHHSE